MAISLYIAGAGAGKTTLIVDMAKERAHSGERVLIATFTNANETEIEKAFYRAGGCVPRNVTVMTWLSFLLQHGVRPYRHSCVGKRIAGLYFDEGRPNTGYARKRTHDYYLLPGTQVVHSGRLAELAFESDIEHDGLVCGRIGRVFDTVFVDESQDLAGYDYDFVARLGSACKEVVLVGDPRQATYRTNWNAQNSGYADVFRYCEAVCGIAIDDKTLSGSRRCSEAVIRLANAVHDQYPPLSSLACYDASSQGAFLVEEDSVNRYIEQMLPVQLRWSKTTSCSAAAPVMNMKDSKGLTFDRVLVYPTKPILKWLAGGPVLESDISRAALYVAITRARYSVAFVVPRGFSSNREELEWWTS